MTWAKTIKNQFMCEDLTSEVYRKDKFVGISGDKEKGWKERDSG